MAEHTSPTMRLHSNAYSPISRQRAKRVGETNAEYSQEHSQYLSGRRRMSTAEVLFVAIRNPMAWRIKVANANTKLRDCGNWALYQLFELAVSPNLASSPYGFAFQAR